MAARVNKTFVVGLIVVVGLVAGAAIFLYIQVATKSAEDHIRLGDAALAAGDVPTASREYSMAVNDDPTNATYLGKWLSAMERVTPDSQTVYQSQFFQQYLPLLERIAETERTNVASHRRFLDVELEWRTLGQVNRQSADAAIADVTAALAMCASGSPPPEGYEALRRYRGLHLSQLNADAGPISAEEQQRMIEDLTAALAVDPADGRAAAALLQAYSARAENAAAQGRAEEARAERAKAQQVLDRLVQAAPENPWGRLFSFALEMERARDAAVSADTPPAERTRVLRDTFASFQPRLDELAQWMAGLPVGTVPFEVVGRLQLLETFVDPRASGRRTQEMLEKRLEADPTNGPYMLRAAQIAVTRGDAERGRDLASRLLQLKPLPMSLGGLIQFDIQTSAPRLLAEIELAAARRAPAGSPERAAAVTAAKAARDDFAKRVAEGNSQLLLLDGILAQLEGDEQKALDMFARFNTATLDSDDTGLWEEGRAAATMGRYGQAQAKLQKLIARRPADVRGLITLAEVEEQLGRRENLDRALQLIAQVEQLQPTGELETTVARLRERLELKAGLRQSEDPVEAVLLEARRAQRGEAGPAKQVEVLRAGLEANNADPRIALELASALLNANDFPGARAVVEQSRLRHRDDERLQKLERALAANSVPEALLILIDQREGPEIDKALTRYQVLAQAGMADRAEAELAKAVELAPDNPTVIELQFLRAIGRGELDAAQGFATRGAAANSDGYNGVTMQARMESARGNHARAVTLLEGITAQGAPDAVIWRLLASEQIQAGRGEAAVESLRRALQIRPDDVQTIVTYISTLASLGRTQEALNEARRLRAFGGNAPGFLNLYLALEAAEGGPEGRRLAIERRRRLLTEQPGDRENKVALSALYIEDRQWLESRKLIDELRQAGDSLELVALDARWYASQGRVKTDKGFEDGIELARAQFVQHILGLNEDKAIVDAYLAMARFMVERGRYDVAVRAVEEARTRQDPKLMNADKLLGDLMLTLDRAVEAADAFRRVVEAGADDEAGSYRQRLVEMLLRQAKYAEAETQIAALNEAQRKELTVRLQISDVQVGLGKFPEARRTLDDAVAAFPDRPIVFAKRAQLSLSQGAPAVEVLRDLDQALRLDPADWRTLRLRAGVFFRDNRAEDAIRDLRAAVRANPTLDEVLVGLMIELIKLNRDGEALDAAIEVIDKRPADATLMLTAGRVFSDRDLWTRASVLYRRAWELTQDPRLGVRYIDALVNSTPPQPDLADAVVTRLGELGRDVEKDPPIVISRALIEMARGKPERAKGFMTQAFNNLGNSPADHLNWQTNVSRLFKGSPTGSDVAYLTEVQRALETAGAPAESRDWIGFALGRRIMEADGSVDQGEAQLLALAQNPATAEFVRLLSHRLMGSVRYRLNEFDKAEQAWRRGLEAFPTDWEMLNNQAFVLASNLNRPEEALPIADKAIEQNQNASEPWDTKAKVLIRLKRLDEAEQALENAERRVSTGQSRVNVLLNRARLEHARGKNDLAKRYLIDAETSTETLPQLKEVVEKDIEAVRAELGLPAASR